jgi:hypothetical protein
MAELLTISGCDKPDRELDLIFVHGLDGDGRSTWQKDDNPANFWPGWIGDELPNIGVWSLNYEVSSSDWKGHTMPLYARARDCLDRLDLTEIGHRPIGFVCHSLGGLLVKQMLKLAKEFGNNSWRPISEQTQFIVFLSTPHSGADMANWISHLGILLRTSVSIQELEAHNPALLELNTWYCNNVGEIKTYVYCETRPTHGILVVNETSANPGIQGVFPIPLDADHVTICKPATKTASVYLRVKRLISETLQEQSNADIEQTKKSSGKDDKTAGLFVGKTVATVSYSGKAKLEFYDRLSTDWRQLADLLDIKSSEQARWERGDEARAIWEWLWRRNRLGELPGLLQEIQRNDLAITLDPK